MPTPQRVTYDDAIEPLVQFIAGLRIGRFYPFRRAAILILLVAVISGMVLFGFLALPPVIRDLQEFGREMPQRLPGIMERLKHFPLLSRVNLGGYSPRFRASPRIAQPTSCFRSGTGQGRYSPLRWG